MTRSRLLILIIFLGLAIGLGVAVARGRELAQIALLTPSQSETDQIGNGEEQTIIDALLPSQQTGLEIEVQRQQAYPGSQLVIERELPAGNGFSRSIASYQSEGLKIYGVLAVPNGEPPEGGWPAIVFNHGYIPPDEYNSTQKYVAYIAGFARQGYVVF